MALPTNPATHKYLFTDDIIFVQKAVIMHPTDPTFLSIKRSENERVRPNTWDLPGGCTLYGETHTAALTREIMEETGLLVTFPQAIFASTSFDPLQPMYFMLLASRCRTTSDHVILSEEHLEFMWVTPEDFLKDDPAYTFVENRPLNPQSTDFLRDIVHYCFR